MTIHLEPDLQVVIGLVVTMVLGLGVGCFVDRVCRELESFPPPSETTRDQWQKFAVMPTAGKSIGRIELVIFYASLWIAGAWPLLSSWLVFKLALYWQGSNFTALPEKPPGWVEVDYLFAKRKIGTYRVSRTLVGTGTNIIVALIGVAAGKWIVIS